MSTQQDLERNQSTIEPNNHKKINEYWPFVGLLAFLFLGIGIGFIVAGWHTTYDVEMMESGGGAFTLSDEYNYIVAANRGTALIVIGSCSILLCAASSIVTMLMKISAKK